MSNIPYRKMIIPAAGLMLGFVGCKHHSTNVDIQTPPLGTISDSVWQKQESNAEATEFIVYEHEFVGNTVRLNRAGEDHIKQIAVRAGNVPFPVVIERSSMSVKEGTKHGFPVHNDPVLDKQRRELVVQILKTMGVEDAAERTVVAPSFTPGFQSFEAEKAYNANFSSSGGNSGGFGGFGGGGGGFGGF